MRVWKVCKQIYHRQLFYATRLDQVYCSNTCRTFATRQRQGRVLAGARRLTGGAAQKFYRDYRQRLADLKGLEQAA